MLLICIIYIIRLFTLQILNSDYKTFADSNAFLKRTIYPSRGLIYDRNGELLVYNQPAYDLMMVMREVKEFDTLNLCNTLNITKEQFDKRIKDIKDRRLNPGYSSYTPQTFMNQLSGKDYGLLMEKMYKFPGFYIQNRTIRQYKYLMAPHILGNIREVSKKEIENDSYYQRGDYTGDLGVEKTYEPYLRGEKGVEVLLRDAHGRVKGKYENGDFDESPTPGLNLTLSIDAELQQYAEMLMQNKVGALVAIEPHTGEILAMVSAPTFNPAELVGRERGKKYLELTRDPYKPLYDRAISASYPPGSTFKLTQGLITLEEGIITENTNFSCSHGYVVGRFRLGCHAHASPLPLKPAIATSCNAYFCASFRSMMDSKKYGSIQESFDLWKDYLVSMGYGYKTGIDIPSEGRGFIPNSNFYNKVFKTDRWKSLNIVSIAIGQGEILATPLQIANLSATIANRGYFYTPHVVKSIQDGELPEELTKPRHTMVSQKYYETIVEGMAMAVTGGTCRSAAIPDVVVCGKTGTSQNPHGKDHSVFTGFAPKDDPKIAIAVYIEQGGFGATYGVPIGSLVMEKYLKGEISESRKWIEDRMVNANLLQTHVIKK